MISKEIEFKLYRARQEYLMIYKYPSTAFYTAIMSHKNKHELFDSVKNKIHFVGENKEQPCYEDIQIITSEDVGDEIWFFGENFIE